jgi:manganese transport protein
MINPPDTLGSVRFDPRASWVKRAFAFVGPGLMVSVGYMDPGNWATDLLGGSRFGYALLWVIVLSSLSAQFLQVLCARLGLVTGRDLAQLCGQQFSRPLSFMLWILCEVAIIACDLAEVIGSAVGLQLLFGIPLPVGVVLTGLDVLMLLALTQRGYRWVEAVVAVLVFTVGGCFAFQILAAQPDWKRVFTGMTTPVLPGAGALVVALGILGATVMPHNLYLHSALMRTRAVPPEDLPQALRLATWDTVVSLGIAFFVNAAILVLAASQFHHRGVEVEQLEQAHSLLTPLLGGAAATAFAVALLASGQSSTITGTLAGQVVMEGFMKWKVAPWKRRLVSRVIAIVPALAVVVATGGRNTVDLLVVSQVVLSMQLPFAILPLVFFTSSKKLMGTHASKPVVAVIGYTISAAIVGLNLKLLFDTTGAGGMAAIFGGVVLLGAGAMAVDRVLPARELRPE